MKKVFKILLWIFIVLFIVSIITTTLDVLKSKFNWNFGNKETYITEKIENGMGDQLFGGYTVEEIETLRQDLEAPIKDDIFQDFLIQDLGNYVIVFRKTKDSSNKDIYPNALFLKTDKGLIFDGVVGVTAEIETNWWNGSHNFESLKYNVDLNVVNYDLSQVNLGVKIVFGTLLSGLLYPGAFVDHENIVTFSDFNANFCNRFYSMNGIAKLVMNEQVELGKLQDYTRRYLLNTIIKPYFLKIEDAQIFENIDNLSASEIDTKAIGKFNSYITYLYSQSKNLTSETTKLVSLNDYFVVPIPEGEIEKYPVSDLKQNDYNGKKYYLAFNCNIIANCSFNVSKTEIVRNPIVPDIPVDPPPQIIKDFVKVHVTLNNKDNSDLSMFNIVKEPITIKFNNSSVVFDSTNDLLNGIDIALEKNVVEYYTIYSQGLSFESYSGSFTPVKDNISLSFDYSYQYGYVYTSIKIMPISASQSTDFNLATYPVKIVLTGKNNEGTYQFIWDNNLNVNSQIGMYVKKGNYAFSVLSEQLIFGATTGDITIDETSRLFTFSYSVNEYKDNLKFSIDVTESSLNASLNDIALSGSSDTVSLLSSKLGDTSYKVFLKIFDTSGLIVKSFEHSHVSTSVTCSDTWASNGTLTSGETYTLQMLYQSSINPADSYTSGVTTFVYKENTKFTFTYSYVEI